MTEREGEGHGSFGAPVLWCPRPCQPFGLFGPMGRRVGRHAGELAKGGAAETRAGGPGVGGGAWLTKPSEKAAAGGAVLAHLTHFP